MVDAPIGNHMGLGHSAFITPEGKTV